MQRRAAAIYAALFIVLAAGSYAVIGVAQEPAVSVDNPDYTLSTGQEVTINGRTYTASVSGGSAELTWTNDSAVATETWEDNATVTLDGTDFTVAVENLSDPETVSLREVRSLGENVTTVETDAGTFVVVMEDGQRTLVPRGAYLTRQQGPAEVRFYDEGDQFTYQNNTVTVAEVTTDGATLEWPTTTENTVTASEGDNVTLNGATFVAHFPDASTLELSSDLRAYQNELDVIDTYHERINGLWGVSILSGLAAILVLGLAYMPSRY